MAFMGKASKEGTSKANVAIKVTCNKNGRLGVVFRNGLIPEGTEVDVKVGTEEDHGLLMVVFGGPDAVPVKSLGHNGNSTSWSGIRTRATKGLPEMKRRPCIIKDQTKAYILIDMQLDNAAIVDEGEGEEVEYPAIVGAETAEEATVNIDGVSVPEEAVSADLGL